MRVLKFKKNIDKDGHLRLDLPTEIPKGKMIEVILVLNPIEKLIEGKTQKKYDFSDLAGKLNWQGDALKEQKRIRNEWE
ncbi:hypothetical protein ACFL2K_00750 [Candidatus Margulisiibacteriota bacterium]